MKKYLRVGVGTLIGVGIILYLVFRPMSYEIPVNSEQGSMGITMLKPNLDYNVKTNEYAVYNESKSYSVPEKEALELKKEILELVCQLKYYRTPFTLINNVKEENLIYKTEESVWITSVRTAEVLDRNRYDNDIKVAGKYIIINGKMYSLGMEGEEKAAWLYEEIEALLQEKAGDYLNK